MIMVTIVEVLDSMTEVPYLGLYMFINAAS